MTDPTLGQLVIGVEGLALLRRLYVADGAGARADRLAEIRDALDRRDLDVPLGTETDVDAGYVQWSRSYDAPLRLFAVEGAAVRPRVDAWAPGTVLDAACGTGRWSEYLAARGHTIVGVDRSPAMLDLARPKVPGGRFEEGRLDALPLDDACVDNAVCALAMVHVADLGPVFAELARVVRPGGRVVVSDVHPFLVALGWQAQFPGTDGRAFIRLCPHLVSDYASAALAAGFAVRGVGEPRVTDEAAATPTATLVPEANTAAYVGLPAVVVWDFERTLRARGGRARNADVAVRPPDGTPSWWDPAPAERRDVTEQNSYPTALGAASRESITPLGTDLAADVMGEVGFGELAFWLATQRRPDRGEVRVFEAVLAALADHGYTPTAIVTRLTYLSAPDSVQGAIAAGLLGGGSRFLGVTEDVGNFLHEVLAAAGAVPTDDAGFDDLALTTVTAARAEKRFVPGLGHHVHKDGDPRTPRLMQIAREEGKFGPHLALFEAIGRVHPQVLGRTLPLNGAGVCGAALADLGLPLALLRGFALLARTAGLIGQLAEEMRHPVGNDIFLSVDLNNRSVPPDPIEPS